VIATPERIDAELSQGVLAHLDVQIGSARHLLALTLAQGAAIRARDVETVIARLSQVKTEMGRRGELEEQRTDLLVRAGIALGVPAPQVTLDAMTTLMPANEAARARQRSAELRGLLAEIAREHGINRALMRQELSFLDHLVRILGQEPEGGYKPSGPAARPASHHVLNLQA
jgi:FlgN protein